MQEAYDALNRNDIPGFLENFDQEIERIEPSGSPGGGIYRGIEALKALVELHRGNWAEGSCQPERFVVVGDRVVVFVHVRVRLKDETEWREGAYRADGFGFCDDKVTQFRTFLDRQQALEWAGAKTPEVD